MKTSETIQTGIIGATIGLLSLFGLKAISTVQNKTDISLLASLAGGIVFVFLYFVILLLGFLLGQSWGRKFMSGFVYGVFGGILGQVMASLAITRNSELSNEIVTAPLCGLLIALLFFDNNRYVALVSLLAVIALVFFVLGTEMDLSTIVMATLIPGGVWLLSPLVSKMLTGIQKQ